jgi:hypothetical protein
MLTLTEKKFREMKSQMVKSLLAVPNISTWDPYLPKMEETPKIYATG